MSKIALAARRGLHKIKGMFHRVYTFRPDAALVPALAFAGAEHVSILRSKRGDSHLVAVILVIVVTVALCIIYQQQVGAFFTSVFNTLKTDVGTLYNFTLGSGS